MLGWCSSSSLLLISLSLFFFLAATKEAAFMFSIMSASIAHVTAGLCASDEAHSLPCECSNESISFPVPNSETVILPGCSYDIEYGLELSKQFMDSFDIFSSDLEKFSLHNNRVGRLVSESNFQNSFPLCSCCFRLHGNDLTAYRELPFQCTNNWIAYMIQYTRWSM